MSVLLITEDAALLSKWLAENETDVVYLWSESIVEHPGLEGHILSLVMDRSAAEKYGNWLEILELPEPAKSAPKPKKAKGGKKADSKKSESVRPSE